MSRDTQTPKRSLERLDDGRPRFHGCSRIIDYEYLGKLGEGTFGEVSKARSKKKGHLVAMKKILMHNEKDGFPITALREIKLLKQLDHINVLKLEEMAVERPKNASKKPSMFMVTPYMDHDLSGLLENPDVRFTEPQRKCYMKQLLEGCAYLHENRILHRDMKAANLLINNRGILQIADFGLARPYDDAPPRPGHGGGEATREYTTLVVTRWYRPPELLLQLRKYTTAIDLWGVGCVFGEMYKEKPILAGNSDVNQAHLIFDLVGSPTDESMPGWRSLPGCEGVKDFGTKSPSIKRVFSELSPTALSLLTELLTLDWRKRINAIDALQHPYFHTEPYPARPGDLPKFEDSHELDRKKFRDQKSKPPPAPSGGAVGIGPEGEWGLNGRPLAHYEPGRVPRGPGGGRHHGTGQHKHGNYNRRLQGPHAHNGAYGADYRGPPPHRDHGSYGHVPRQPYDQPRTNGPPQPYDDGHTRRPQADYVLPPRPPVSEDNHRYGPSDASYRDDGRGPPPSRSRVPGGGPPGGDIRRSNHPHDQDTYIPSYSSADPDHRGPPPKMGRRGDRPHYGEGRREGSVPDYDEPIRYDDTGAANDRERGRMRESDQGPHHTSAAYDRRPRSRSPVRDWERDRDRDRNRDRAPGYRERDRDWDRDRDRHAHQHLPPDRDRGYGGPGNEGGMRGGGPAEPQDVYNGRR
ncbi:CMGC/CDK protein kinase [Exophiala aquamarina CBS 119918]|uniref:Serine/threonine-protein kinase BUR1 n=1 Tax=Exophiala aquamarina CBS 119918 TaxID=1182545 RepID=A0A072PR01_9EURO|nr:CMGC/CDK protein kinase [Exophiala aquamarina CBS 119918]KEF61753.1 CMGC/CDK protein kinase [Exophiala aquamarina CBS 119918]